ncbi:unnamed protein product [Gulo gulo]|uniref:Receptor ligand binding region domain-containing protein n=1 Tax=Gulo gulo TaxID=48420 RepID=A0A9X9PWK9_GULGU|nr:unnamed protein product [Gulo gulo]
MRKCRKLLMPYRTARVVVLYAFDIDPSSFALEIVHHNIIDRIWIVSEAWITSALITRSEYFPYFGGIIGFAIPRADIPGLKEFLYDVHPGKEPSDVLIIAFYKPLLTVFDLIAVFHTTLTIKDKKLEDLKNTYLDVSQLRFKKKVKQAVYSWPMPWMV